MEKKEVEFATLETIGRGVASELFTAEFAKVLANILDPNTKATAARSVSIKISFVPNEQKDMAQVSVASSCHLASIKPASTAVFLKRQGGELFAVVNNVAEQPLPFAEKQEPENVHKIGG